MKIIHPLLFVLSGIFLLSSCSTEKQEDTLFQQLSPSETNVNFENNLTPTEEFNMYIFRNFYNGGGVAVGDLTGNGLPDLFFTGNMTSNRLYENQGDYKFEDITDQAGLRTDGYWSTGASLVDVNGNGLLDIFVALSGPPEGDARHNRLYINNGDGTFDEQAKEFGIADEGLSTHATFFDYNGNGRLDLYLINQSFRSIGDGFGELIGDIRYESDPMGASKLYRNDGDHFTEVTKEAGIFDSIIGFGLSATVADINRNGWPDLYIANDFFERDYLYMNNGDGTFTESLEDKIRSLSFSSMGSDIADINNDGWPDIYVSDMLPFTEERLKSKMTIESWPEYREHVERGFHHKFTRNTLQLNRGDGDFSEIGRYSDAYATDWSWAVLMADFDHSGYNDIYVTNGIYKDLLDQDFIEDVANPRNIREMIDSGDENVIMNLMEQMSSVHLRNFAFGNEGDLRFSDRTAEWGLDEPGFSSGAAWADLNGDGSLDLVVSNTNGPARIYRNRADELYPDRTWLRVDLTGEAPNTQAIGAQLQVWAGGEQRYREHILQRGFQSSVEPGLHVGMGEATMADSLILRWPDGRTSRVSDIELPTRLSLDQSEAEEGNPAPEPPPAQLPGDFTTENLPESDRSRQSSESESNSSDADRTPKNAGTLSGQYSENLPESEAERRSWQSSKSKSNSSDSDGNANEHADRTPKNAGTLSGQYNENLPESDRSWQSSDSPNSSDSDGSANEHALPGRSLLTQSDLAPITGWSHERYEYSDFTRERLLLRMRSTEGPATCRGDVTGNGLDDLYIGGARGQSGALFIQDDEGVFTPLGRDRFAPGEAAEETACALFDATGNGVADLYIASGGNSYGSGSSALRDRFYLNDGNGRFTESDQILPTRRGFEPTSVVRAHDFTGDGNQDLFVGVRLRPFSVGLPANGYLLAGDGEGNFEDVTDRWAPELIESGMITDALWADLTGDGKNELIITGEWMAIRAFANSGDGLEEISGQLGLDETEGWWNSLAVGDVSGNGRLDLIAGGHGENSMFRATPDAPVRMWVGDFAQNGMIEQILTTEKDGDYYPVALRHDLIEEIPALREKFPDYATYAGQTIEEVFSADQLDSARLMEARELRSMIFWNDGDGAPLRGEALPPRAQLAPTYGLATGDLTGNGRDEILLGGNLYGVKPQSGPYDASRGAVLAFDESTGSLGSLRPDQSGVDIDGEIRTIVPVKRADGSTAWVITRYNDNPVVLEMENASSN